MPTLKNLDTFPQMLKGFRETVLLALAVRLDLATAIDLGISDAAGLARHCRVSPRALALCLNALCAIGFLEKSGKRYRNSPAARRLLSAKSPHCIRPALRHALDSTMDWATLPQTVKAGKVARPQPSLRKSDSTDAFIRAMDHHARGSAPAVAAACPIPGARTLLDLGGGPGTFALEFTRRNPGLKATVFDLPQTLRVTRKILKERGMARAPIRLVRGDFLRDPLGGPYDVVLASNILHMLSESECLALLRKSFRALNPGGRIIIYDFLLDKSRVTPVESALFAVHMLVHTIGGRTYSGEEFRDMLRQAGCRSVKIIRHASQAPGLVIGTKPRINK